MAKTKPAGASGGPGKNRKLQSGGSQHHYTTSRFAGQSPNDAWDEYREQIRRAWPMPELVGQTVPLPRFPHGNKPVKVRCPFHADSSPSLAVYGDHAHCFGACSHTWDVFGWLMQRDGLSFAEARDQLARERGIPRPHWTPDDERNAHERQAHEDVMRLAAGYYARRLWEVSGKQALAYARERGWSDEMIRSAQIGYASGGLVAYLLEMGGDLEAAMRVGLIGDDERDFIYNRLVFPYLQRGGRVVYMSGRTLSPDVEPKYLNLPGSKQVYYNVPALSGSATASPIVLVEGITDALALEQWGIAAIALCGVNIAGLDLANIARFCEVFVCLDADEAGRERACEIAETLGALTRLIVLPDGVDDPSAWAKDGATVDDFTKLMSGAPTWLEYQIEKAATLMGFEYDAALRQIFIALAGLEPFAQVRYKGIVKETLRVSASEFNRLLKAVRQEADESESESLQVLEGHYHLLSPALDFSDDLAITTVTVPVLAGGRPRYQPYLVSSAREVVPAPDAGMIELNGQSVLLTSSPTSLRICVRWDWHDMIRFEEGDSPDPLGVFQAIQRLYDKYLDFRESYTSSVLALWVMGTYLHPLFDAFPYVALYGPPASGKTKTLDLTQYLGFNMQMAASISSASLYRIVQEMRASLAIDEAERLSNPRDTVAADLRLLLNAGYKKGAPVIRYNLDLDQVEQFNLYGPKMLASIRGVEQVLASRCIEINMLRTTSEKGGLSVNERGEAWATIRHGLYCFALTCFAEVSDIYLYDPSICVLSNRQNELWKPLLAIAAFLSRRGNGCADLLDCVRSFAERKARNTEVVGLSEWEVALLLALKKLLATQEKPLLEIGTRTIRSAMADYVGEDQIEEVSPQWIGYAIRRLGLLPESSRRRHSREGAIYWIVLAEVLDIMGRYEVKDEK